MKRGIALATILTGMILYSPDCFEKQQNPYQIAPKPKKVEHVYSGIDEMLWSENEYPVSCVNVNKTERVYNNLSQS